ncbi:AraC family transcriptional regulator [Aquimarina sp. AD10]|uniref:helix-turn-helix domain-containing protein n=1 Tax=Aquimarina sp. AD10 TaxID=1714849 RepID=UPI000E4F8C3A|nr:AraC family transcriptional regulator [Aquimarina sp. AD10]AXT61483.1 AraC family transcriptional regulator [Aquimarina sp. AD10]RKM89967.1 helix-turn-helix domain-containing protein [Aquimarina sp. AD10]
MQSFNVIHFILFIGISQGFFLAIVIQIIQHKNKLANRILSLILIIACVMLIGRFFFTIGTSHKLFFRIGLFVDVLVFVFGPLLYLYFRRLIFNEITKHRLSYFTFVPAVCMLIYHFWTYQYSYGEIVIKATIGELTIPFLIIETTGILFNLYYCYCCFQLIRKYQKEKKKNLSFAQNLLPFLIAILVTVVVFLIFWIISYLSYYFLEIYSPFVSYNSIWIAVSIFIYVIGFYSLKQPDFFRMPIENKKERKSKNRLEGTALKVLSTDLENIMMNEKIYLDHKLTLVELANRLNTSTNNVSWLLNNIHKSTFYDYINQYRVKEFIQKIQNGEHHDHTLFALSLDSGFSSKSTFNKAFKMFVNDTPSNYIKKLDLV